MPLFDPLNIKSTEVTDAYALADRLSECDAYQDIVEATDAANARSKIDVATINEPFDDGQFTKEQLENMFSYTRIAPPDEDAMQALLGESLMECPAEGGDLEFYIRRQVRESELNAKNGRDDVFLFMWDRFAAIPAQIMENIQTADGNRPRVASITRRMGPRYATFKSSVSQGQYMWAVFLVEFGNLDIVAGVS